MTKPWTLAEAEAVLASWPDEQTNASFYKDIADRLVATREFVRDRATELKVGLARSSKHDVVLDLLGWAFGLGGWALGCLRVALTGELTPLAACSVALSILGLFRLAYLYERRKRQHRALKDKRRELKRLRLNLDEIEDRLRAVQVRTEPEPTA